MSSENNDVGGDSKPNENATMAQKKAELGSTGLDKRQVKIAVIGFFIMLLASMVSLKPFLFTALWHHEAKIYDYKFFANRVVSARPNASPWPVAEAKIASLPASLKALLDDHQTTALLVIDNGKIAYENYALDGGPSVLSGSFSMAKSMVGLMYGFALQAGRIATLDEPISYYLPEWEDRDEGKITIRNLLTMSSGLNWNETYNNLLSITTEAYFGKDLRLTALRQHAKEEPGVHFEYESGTSQLAGLVLSRAVNQSLSNLLSHELWEPLGAEHDALWSLDHQDGMEKAFCCLNATARDFARIGEFVRLQGKWNGQNLLSDSYIKTMLTPSNLPDAKTGKPAQYGYQWWSMETPKGRIFYADGYLGQYIIILPQVNRVIVRLGKKSMKVPNDVPGELRALVNWGLGT